MCSLCILGKGPDAQQWAQDIRALVRKKYPENNTEVYSEMFGDIGTLHFIAQFESLAALESQMAQVAADDELQSLMALGQDLLVEGSKMTLMQTFF